jgi:hypothetical protein
LVEHLPNILEALGSISSTTEKVEHREAERERERKTTIAIRAFSNHHLSISQWAIDTEAKFSTRERLRFTEGSDNH